MRAMWILAVLAMAFWTPMGLTGCNTIEGAGEDVQAVGEGVEEGAEEAGDGVDNDFD